MAAGSGTDERRLGNHRGYCAEVGSPGIVLRLADDPAIDIVGQCSFRCAEVVTPHGVVRRVDDIVAIVIAGQRHRGSEIVSSDVFRSQCSSVNGGFIDRTWQVKVGR